MEEQTVPVVIIGCGPAAAGASLFLTKAGVRHVILEKDAFPRDKICGDGCSGKTTFVLRKANPALMEEVFADDRHFLPSYGVKFVAPNGRAIDIPFGDDKQVGGQPPGFTSRRLVLDQFLFDKLVNPMAEIRQNTMVTHLERNDHGFSISYRSKGQKISGRIHCSILLGADGDKGISRKTLLQDQQVAKTSAIGVRAYFNGVKGMHEANFIELHFLRKLLPGYFWIFPLPGGQANVGIAMESKNVRSRQLDMKSLLRGIISEHPVISRRFEHAVMEDKIYGWGLPMGVQKRKISGDHFMLLGDAAALIDPFTGEGIGNALYSGMLGAEAAVKALDADCFNAPFFQEHYGDILFKRIGDELKLSYTMQRLVRYPWLFNLVVNKANKSPVLRSTISSMFADLDMRALLRQPSFYWKILTNQ